MRHYYSSSHNRLPNHNSPCRQMIQGTNRFWSCHIITQVLNLQKIDDCYKMTIQPTTAKLNTADVSLMSAIGMMALHLRITEFKFTHNFIICYQLQETELIFGIDIQRKFSISYAWDKEKTVISKKMENLLTYTKNCEQKATIGTIKSTLKIPP